MDNMTKYVETLIADFGACNSFDDAKKLHIDTVNNFFHHNDNSYTAVIVTTTDEGGTINLAEPTCVYIFDSYVNALKKINKYEYAPNTAVQVYEINKKGYASIFQKCFDGVCYSRLACVSFQHWNQFDARKLWDVYARVYYCEHQKYM